MAIVFELCMFTQEYAEKIRNKELRKHPFLKKEDIRVEKGDIFCFNTARRSAISFYDLDEIISLIDAAFSLATEMNRLEPKAVELEEFPTDMVVKGRVELDELFKGRVLWGDEDKAFTTEDEIRNIIDDKILIK
ncbi:MAG TPA: hypothetical protein ENH19_03935 [Actinobacteria bacterium]|nr:hypothetical protein [Actinomycetes bacterium]HEX21783.1 hypothetical protein [Actinomycetota bacterium]